MITRASTARTSGGVENIPPPDGAIAVGRTGYGWAGYWWPVIQESFTGAWQQNVFQRADSVLSYFAVYACATLIASDIAKLTLRLVQEDDDGIWTPIDVPAFSPVLRKPNGYQTIQKFVEQWIITKLIWGNAYILKIRDNRNVVQEMHVLNPMRVYPAITPDGSVYYQLQTDYLAELFEPVWVPASEMIHDRMVAMYHPLVGVSPIYACGLAAYQGLKIQANSTNLFANGSHPGGMLLAPGAISDDTAKRLKDYWNTNFTGDNVGKVAVLGDGLKYEPMTMSAVDAQLIDQLKWTADNVCACFHVAPYMIGIGSPPPYANVEPLVQLYYSQCLQSLITSLETSLDDGLGILNPITTASGPVQYGTECDIDDLIWMDTRTRSEAAAKATGTLSPNETRAKYFGVGPTTGGDSPMVQQQYYSLDALAKRDAADPFAKPTPPVPATPATPPANAPAGNLRALTADAEWSGALAAAIRREQRRRVPHAA
jgi:HK97 family phage portal protein